MYYTVRKTYLNFAPICSSENKNGENCERKRTSIDKERISMRTVWLCNLWCATPHWRLACEIIIIKYSDGSKQMNPRPYTYSRWLAVFGGKNRIFIIFSLRRKLPRASYERIKIIINNMVGHTEIATWNVQILPATNLMRPLYVAKLLRSNIEVEMGICGQAMAILWQCWIRANALFELYPIIQSNGS